MGLILHNINTPLDIIRMKADLLLRNAASGSPDAAVVAAHARTIDGQAERIARVRQEYLKLQKPWESRREKADLHTLVRVTTKEWTHPYENILVAYELEGEIGEVQADCAVLRLSMGVLLRNSTDAIAKAQDGRIRVRLRQASLEEANRTAGLNAVLALDVVDNGPGVPPGQRDALFKVMKSGKAKGLGFGLSYCRQALRSAGGDVYYHSGTEEGATFTILLPYSVQP
jgi:signal transduction histidine kinase